MAKFINAEVTKTQNVSEVVINYIITQTQNDEPPFELSQFASLKRLKETQLRRSNASEWRALVDLQERRLAKQSEPLSIRKTNQSFGSNAKVKAQIYRNSKQKSLSVRQSFLESALMQSFYEGEYIDERKMYTSKIQQHYSKEHSQRPRSINCPHRKQFYTQRNWNQSMKGLVEKVAAVNHKKLENSKLANKLYLEKYETVRIKRRFLRKERDIVILGMKQPTTTKSVKGLIYCPS